MRTLAQTSVVYDTALFQVRKHYKYTASRLSLMYAIYCERRKMRNLSDEILKDIGINRTDMLRECSKRISDIPENRIRESRDSN